MESVRLGSAPQGALVLVLLRKAVTAPERLVEQMGALQPVRLVVGWMLAPEMWLGLALQEVAKAGLPPVWALAGT